MKNALRPQVLKRQIVRVCFSDGIAHYVAIDSCEYYELQFHGAEYCTHYNLIHRGNCKNCRKFLTELYKK